MLVTEFMEAGDLWHAMVQHQASGILKWYKRYTFACFKSLEDRLPPSDPGVPMTTMLFETVISHLCQSIQTC